MVLGEQDLPVRSDVAAPDTRKALPLSFVIWLMASATDEVGTSTITSTPSASYHLLAIWEPTSGLFWWSANTTSTLSPFSFALKSSTAIFAASVDPDPAMSAQVPDWSITPPIMTTLPEILASAPAV